MDTKKIESEINGHVGCFRIFDSMNRILLLLIELKIVMSRNGVYMLCEVFFDFSLFLHSYNYIGIWNDFIALLNLETRPSDIGKRYCDVFGIA